MKAGRLTELFFGLATLLQTAAFCDQQLPPCMEDMR